MTRLNKLRRLLEKEGIDCFLIGSPYNIAYLSGLGGFSPVEREAFMLITPTHNHLVTDLRYAGMIKNNDQFRIEITGRKENYYQKILHLLEKVKKHRLSFEEDNMRVAEHRYLLKLNPHLGLEPRKGIVESLRSVKDRQETDHIKKACRVAGAALEKVMSKGLENRSEAEVSFDLEKEIRNCGGEDIAFEPIVAMNKHSAIPHHTAGKRKITDGVLLIDLGTKYHGYVSDMTRTFNIPKKSGQERLGRKFQAIYQKVMEAQSEALSKIRVGMQAREAFQIANRIFEKYALAECFTHSLGHGLGLEIHEEPHLSPTSEAELKEGMVFTIEPGLYLEGRFGVRIEDTVLLTKKGCLSLTRYPKETD